MVETAVRGLSTLFLMLVLSCPVWTPCSVDWVVYRLNGHEFESGLGVGEGQESLACCRLWGRKESDTTEQPLAGYILHKQTLTPRVMALGVGTQLGRQWPAPNWLTGHRGPSQGTLSPQPVLENGTVLCPSALGPVPLPPAWLLSKQPLLLAL